MSRNKSRKEPYIKHICAVHVYEIWNAYTVLWNYHLYTLHINIYTVIKNKLFCNNNFEKEVVFADISNPNTSISKIIDILRPVDEWAEIAFSARQNAENEHCETLKKLVHKLNFHQ